MISSKLKNDIDRLWTEFWTGGIANPLTVIEQISFLMFARLLDIDETRVEKLAQRTGKPPHKNFGPDQQNLRWKNWKFGNTWMRQAPPNSISLTAIQIPGCNRR